MYQSEGKLRAAFVQALRYNKILAQPIESGSTGLGIPDMFLRTGKHSVWAEFKNAKYAIQLPYTVPFRPGQYRWLKDYYSLGGLSLLVIGTPEGIYIFRNESIKKQYIKPLADCCNLFMPTVNGKVFIDWLNLQ